MQIGSITHGGLEVLVYSNFQLYINPGSASFLISIVLNKYVLLHWQMHVTFGHFLISWVLLNESHLLVFDVM